MLRVDKHPVFLVNDVRVAGGWNDVVRAIIFTDALRALDIGALALSFSTNYSDTYVRPVADPAGFDMMPFKGKAMSIHWN